MNTFWTQMMGSTALSNLLIRDTGEGGGGGGAGEEGGGGTDTVEGGGGSDTVEGGGGDDTVAGGGGDDHWSDKHDFGDDGDVLREHLVKSGFHKAESPEDALGIILKAHMSAEKRLGKPADQMLELPGEGDDLVEWRTKHAKQLGIPTGEESYDWTPGDLPEGMFWDKDREASILERAKTRGVPGDIVKGIMDDYLDMMKGDYQSITKEISDRQDAMRSELTKEWGGSVSGNLALARRALTHFGKEAGLPAESINAVEAKMLDGTGVKDAQLARLWHQIGKAMGEDTGAGDILAGDGAGFAGGATVGELKNEKANIMRKGDGLIAKAQANNNQQEVKRLQARLSEINKHLAGS